MKIVKRQKKNWQKALKTVFAFFLKRTFHTNLNAKAVFWWGATKSLAI